MSKRELSGLIGVVHLRAMPGDPKCQDSSFDAVYESATADASAYKTGGISQLIVENFGSAPFQKGDSTSRIPAQQAAAITLIVKQLVEDGFVVGVNCLRNDAMTALGIAAATGAHFIRVNVHTGAYVTDQGLIEGQAWQTLRERQRLQAEHIAIAADILVKHAAPLAPISPAVATHDTFDRGLADAVIVSGTGTGRPVDKNVLHEVRAAAGKRPVWIGSGITVNNLETFAPYIDGAIVGTSVKRGGELNAPVDRERVAKLVAEANRCWDPAESA